ncbi:MAG: hypothetical protein M3494_06800 [Actinomycetota bacterium]|jgi:hypothetical protein|nr:hypothetical protein [Rubrobacter sp.]MDQ3507707.1 hypothetical protein [Actinomycetota bacterium]
MKTISKLDEVERVFLEDLSEDYEGVWTLADRVSGALGIEDPAAVREVSLRLIHEWLASDRILPGVPKGDSPGFEPWPERREEAAVKLAAEWREVGRFPLLGEIAWFSLTPEGGKLLEERPASRQ